MRNDAYKEKGTQRESPGIGDLLHGTSNWISQKLSNLLDTQSSYTADGFYEVVTSGRNSGKQEKDERRSPVIGYSHNH